MSGSSPKFSSIISFLLCIALRVDNGHATGSGTGSGSSEGASLVRVARQVAGEGDVPSSCGRVQVDVVFLLDTSASVDDESYKDALNVVVQFVNSLKAVISNHCKQFQGFFTLLFLFLRGRLRVRKCDR